MILLIFFKTLRRKTFLIFMLLLGATQAVHAQEPFIVHGLSFNCDGCSFAEDNTCQRIYSTRTALLTCDELLDHLLLEAATASSNSLPTAEEIAQVLLRSGLSAERIQLLLEILSKRSPTEQTLNKAIYAVLSSHQQPLLSILAERALPPLILDAFWKAESLGSGENGMKLRAAIAVRNSSVQFADIIAELSSSDYTIDSLFLKTIINEAKPLRPEWVATASSLLDLVNICQVSLNNLRLVSECIRNAGFFSGTEAKSYANRLLVHTILQAVTINNLDPFAAFTLIAQTNYKETSTPELHNIIIQNLDFLISSKSDGRNEMAASHVEMLEFLAKSDPTINLKLNQLLQPNEESNDQSEVPPTIILFVLGIGLISLIAIRRRQKSLASRFAITVESDDLSSIERQELRELMSYFDLPGFSDPQELTTRFRQEARRVHPDTGKDDPAAFTQLKSKYERAKTLLEKRRGNSY